MTWVPLLRPVRSSVVPAGTVMSFSVMVLQLFLFAMAVAASVKVQLARSLSGAGTGLAATRAPRERRRVAECMVISKEEKSSRECCKGKTIPKGRLEDAV